MGFRNVTNIHTDLLLALDRKQRTQLAPFTVLLGDVRLPCIGSVPGEGKNGSGGPVQLSAGLIDFLNRVAHAKAIDESDHGFFLRYTTQIATKNRNSAVPDFDALPTPTARDFQTMNRQASQFNQMAGGLVAIDLAHHYLGHYSRHAAELASDTTLPMPVNTLITEQEWREAVLRGAHNALACGLGVEGLKTLFECFDRMPSRPAWSAYFLPPKANVTKLNAELKKLEREFFTMDQQMQKAGHRR